MLLKIPFEKGLIRSSHPIQNNQKSIQKVFHSPIRKEDLHRPVIQSDLKSHSKSHSKTHPERSLIQTNHPIPIIQESSECDSIVTHKSSQVQFTPKLTNLRVSSRVQRKSTHTYAVRTQVLGSTQGTWLTRIPARCADLCTQAQGVSSLMCLYGKSQCKRFGLFVQTGDEACGLMNESRNARSRSRMPHESHSPYSTS